MSAAGRQTLRVLDGSYVLDRRADLTEAISRADVLAVVFGPDGSTVMRRDDTGEDGGRPPSPAVTAVGYAVGVDLGTTESVVVVIEGGVPTAIANSGGLRLTPSVVAFTRDGEVLVGQSAKNQAVTNVHRTIRSVKRHMGSDWKTPDIDGKRYSAQEISARVLQKLKRDAEAYLDDEITDAVIAVPVMFDTAQRQATKEARQIAGLNVLCIVNEPTAAALAYGLDKAEKEQTILVFDLGGGSFDVAVLEIGEGVVEVKAVSGDTQLGGSDWDERIVTWLVDKFKSSHGIDLTRDKMAMQRLREAAEKAKIELSSQSTATINLPYITVDPWSTPAPPSAGPPTPTAPGPTPGRTPGCAHHLTSRGCRRHQSPLRLGSTARP